MAGKATWLCHVDARECLRGTKVTCHLHIYFIYIGYRTYKPFHRGISPTYEIDSHYIPDDASCFSKCGTKLPRFALIAERVAR